MNADEQAETLLALVERYRQSQCEACISEAQSQAATLLREVYREARRRLRLVITEERQKAQVAIAAAHARLQTVKRLQRQKQIMVLLNEAWPRLRAELARRWHDPGARHTWVEDLVREAFRALPGEGWQIHHPSDWPVEEIEALRARLATQLKTSPEFMPDSAISAGLRIAAEHTILDGTLEGLLADRPSIEARLLYYLEEKRP